MALVIPINTNTNATTTNLTDISSQATAANFISSTTRPIATAPLTTGTKAMTTALRSTIAKATATVTSFETSSNATVTTNIEKDTTRQVKTSSKTATTVSVVATTLPISTATTPATTTPLQTISTSRVTTIPTDTTTLTNTGPATHIPTNSTSRKTTKSTDASSTTTITSTCGVPRAYCPSCGVATIAVAGLRIVNGAAASANEYPHQVVVYPTILNVRYLCGGSIIKKRWILTAAHCFYDGYGRKAGQNDIEVGYGSSDIYLMTVVRARRYIVHENYDRFTQDNDIALIELPSDLNYESDNAIQPICLAEESDITDGIKAVAAGWGTTAYLVGSTVTQLREVALDVIPMNECARLAILPTNSSTVLCALTNYKDTCQGDSGGPLIVQNCPNRWVQIGIVSYGDECAKPNSPGVYTRVPAYRNWIDERTGSSTTC
ncbi:chymotrypsin B-like [Palaemon carinicauda]|uniref:chymotrypsin B-like n=1 Tax=Palaemon carinicauda TaxID=392227 RepID=UPI0035B5C531